MSLRGKVIESVDNGVGPDKQSRVRVEFSDGTALVVRVEREVESRLSGSPALPTGGLTVEVVSP